jgi:hypothetical protein
MTVPYAPASPSNSPGTSGIQVAQYLQLTGTGVTAVGVDLTTQDGGESLNSAFGAVGQGHGAHPTVHAGDSRPVAQYGVTLSLSGATVNGVVYPKSVALVAAIVDVLNNPVPAGEYYQGYEYNWISLGSVPKSAGTYFNRTNNFVSTNAAPASGSPAYPAGAVVTLGTPSGTYDADIVITAAAVGQCVVKVQAPWANNTLGETQDDGYDSPPGFNTPVMGIETELVVSVIK